MARLIPPSLPGSTPQSEKAVWMALRDLPDPWRVFHGVEWQAERDGRPGDGEADFVLLHPKVGFIVLEVKGGGVGVVDGLWHSIDRNGDRHDIRDPFEQAKTSKYTLLEYLKDAVGTTAYIPAGHAVIFTDVAAPAGLGANAPEEIAIGRNDYGRAAEMVQRLIDHWELKAELAPSIVSAIADHNPGMARTTPGSVERCQFL